MRNIVKKPLGVVREGFSGEVAFQLRPSRREGNQPCAERSDGRAGTGLAGGRSRGRPAWSGRSPWGWGRGRKGCQTGSDACRQGPGRVRRAPPGLGEAPAHATQCPSGAVACSQGPEPRSRGGCWKQQPGHLRVSPAGPGPLSAARQKPPGGSEPRAAGPWVFLRLSWASALGTGACRERGREAAGVECRPGARPCAHVTSVLQASREAPSSCLPHAR